MGNLPEPLLTERVNPVGHVTTDKPITPNTTHNSGIPQQAPDMKWLQLLSAVKAAPAVADDRSLSFEAPFTQTDWVLTGDARVQDTGVELAHAPGQSGAVWFRDAVPYTSWTLEAVLKPVSEFQNSAGTGGYTLWFTSEPQAKPSDASLSTHGGPDKWDGLAVMVDSLLENGGGSVRGHLNDGSTTFSQLTDVGTESLSLCRIDYRQSAAPLSVRIGYSEDGFVVSVNHQKCFMSTDIVLPSGYFGISANTDKTRDILGIERLAIKPHMISELYDLLPHHETVASAPENPTTIVDEPADRITRSSDVDGSPAITKLQLLELMKPSLDRIELMDVRMKQIQSALDQLSETLSLSLRDSSSAEKTGKKAGSKPGGADSGAVANDLAGLHDDILAMRKQITELRQSQPKTAATSAATTPASGAPSLLSLVCVLVPVQFGVVLVYHGWLRRREQRGKLL